MTRPAREIARVVWGPLRCQTIAKKSRCPNPNYQVVDTNLNAQNIDTNKKQQKNMTQSARELRVSFAVPCASKL